MAWLTDEAASLPQCVGIFADRRMIRRTICCAWPLESIQLANNGKPGLASQLTRITSI